MKIDTMFVLECVDLFCVLPLNQINMVEKKDDTLRIDLETGYKISLTSKDQNELTLAYETLRKQVIDYYNPPSLWEKFLRLIKRNVYGENL